MINGTPVWLLEILQKLIGFGESLRRHTESKIPFKVSFDKNLKNIHPNNAFLLRPVSPLERVI